MHRDAGRSARLDPYRPSPASGIDRWGVNDPAIERNRDGTMQTRRIVGQGRLALELKCECLFQQLGSEALAPGRLDPVPSPLPPVEDQLSRIGAIFDAPGYIDATGRLAQRAILDGIGGELVDREREGLRRL